VYVVSLFVSFNVFNQFYACSVILCCITCCFFVLYFIVTSLALWLQHTNKVHFLTYLVYLLHHGVILIICAHFYPPNAMLPLYASVSVISRGSAGGQSQDS